MIIQRLKQYIDEKGINICAFEKSLGMSNGSFGSALKNNRAIRSKSLENILTIYTDINPDWLLTGNGPMLRQSTSDGTENEQVDPDGDPILKEANPPYNKTDILSNEKFNVLDTENKILKAKAEFLTEKIELLEKTIRDKESIIDLLSNN